MRTIYSECSDFTSGHPLDTAYCPGHGAMAYASSWTRPSFPSERVSEDDEEFRKKVEEYDRKIQEINSEWKLPIPWSNSLVFDPKDILGPPPPSPPPFTYDDEQEAESPAPKRKKKAASNKENAVPVFLPIDLTADAPSPPASPTKPSPTATPRARPAVSAARLRATARPRPNKSPARAASPQPMAVDADGNDGLAPGFMRCRYGGCKAVIERELWQEHMDSAAHQLRHQARGVGRYVCRWTGCTRSYKMHPGIVEHLGTTHFAPGREGL